MKTTMLKKQISVTRVLAVILCLGVLSYSITSFGDATEEVIFLNCSTKIYRVGEEEAGTWISYLGQPNRQYILETLGLYDNNKREIVTLTPTMGHSRGLTSDSVRIGVTASCNQPGGGAYMAKTGAILLCEVGRGLWIKVGYLANGNPAQYKYAGKLTIVDYDEEDYEDEELSIESEEGMGMQDTIMGVENLKLGSSVQILLPPMGLAAMDCSMGFSN